MNLTEFKKIYDALPQNEDKMHPKDIKVTVAGKECTSFSKEEVFTPKRFHVQLDGHPEEVAKEFLKLLEESRLPIIVSNDFGTLKNDVWSALQKPSDLKPYAIEQAFSKHGLGEVGRVLAEGIESLDLELQEERNTQPYCVSCEEPLEQCLNPVCGKCRDDQMEEKIESLKTENENLRREMEEAEEILIEVKEDLENLIESTKRPKTPHSEQNSRLKRF